MSNQLCDLGLTYPSHGLRNCKYFSCPQLRVVDYGINALANSNSCLSLFPQLRPFIGHVPKDVCSRPVFCGAFLHQCLHGPKKRRLYLSGANRGVIRSCLGIALLGTNQRKKSTRQKLLAAQAHGTAQALIDTIPAQSLSYQKFQVQSGPC
jgi:hypothetical protein